MVGHDVNTIYCERHRDMRRLSEGSRSNKTFILAVPLVPAHCRCRVLLLHVIILSNTHTVGRALLDEQSARRRGPVPVLHTSFTRDKHPCPRRDKRNATDIYIYIYREREREREMNEKGMFLE